MGLNPKLWDKTAPLGRITDYDKVLPIVELYRCVQSPKEVDSAVLQLLYVLLVVLTDAWFGEGGWCDSLVHKYSS
jgi:hypothetical protein